MLCTLIVLVLESLESVNSLCKMEWVLNLSSLNRIQG